MTLASCADFFDQPGDGEAIEEGRFFSDESAYRQAVTDVYIQLRDTALYGGTLTLTLLEEAAGMLAPYDEATTAAARGDFADAEVCARLEATRQAAERAMTVCRHIIDNATDRQLQSAEVRMAVGEAYGLRAALTFDLYRLSLLPASVLTTVEADLEAAAAMLKTTDPLVITTSQTTVRVGQQDRRLRTMMLNWYAVKALQARVALWQGRYDDALAAADSVFQPLSTLAERYRVYYYVQPGKYGADFCFSREFLFGIATSPDGFPALSDRLFVEHGVKTTARLRDIYADAADIRYRAWFRPTAASDGYVMSRKFSTETLLSGYVVSATGSEMQLPASIPYIKIGEVALIAAEALNETGRPAEALQWIETLEQTKDAGSYAAALRDAGTVGQTEVARLIEAERERELFGEGQLYYYQQRMKR